MTPKQQEKLKEFAKRFIGKTVEIKKIGFNSKSYFEETKECFDYLPIPEYGVGLFLKKESS